MFLDVQANTISSGIAPTTTILGPGPGRGPGSVKTKSAFLLRASNFKARPDAGCPLAVLGYCCPPPFSPFDLLLWVLEGLKLCLS